MDTRLSIVPLLVLSACADIEARRMKAEDDGPENGETKEAETRPRSPAARDEHTARRAGKSADAPAPESKAAPVEEIAATGGLALDGDGIGGGGSAVGYGRAGLAAPPAGVAGGEVSGALQEVYGSVSGAAAEAPKKAVGGPIPVAEGTERYDHIAENSFEPALQEPLSTFSIDVDTASYSNVRRYLQEGSLPPRDAVRVEELLNYFPYEYPEPTAGQPFTVVTEVGSCPWAPNHRLVHVGLQGDHLSRAELPARNLTFLVDVSGSMDSPDRLPLVKLGLRRLTEQLRADDHVSIVVYAGAAGLVLPPTSGADKGRILAALDRLEAGGSTAGGEGIALAYDVAKRHYRKGAINRVVLATDGDFNVGVSNDSDLIRMVEGERDSGVFLTVLGFGRGNLQDARMEQIADKGNGNYAYIDSAEEAHKAFGKEAGASLVTIAKDVKIQVEWNPTEVQAYRLVGYENRLLAAQDFHDDRKDAGEIGAGHSVTALYEVVPHGQAAPMVGVDPLKYQQARPSGAAARGELLTVKLRWKAPEANESQLASFPLVDQGKGWTSASGDFRFAAAVASFGMLLRDSAHKGEATWAQVRELGRGALGRDEGGLRREFLTLVDRASELQAPVVGQVEDRDGLRRVTR